MSPVFFDFIPYDEISVRISEADVDQIEDILRAIPPQKIRRMQRALRRFHRYFYFQARKVGSNHWPKLHPQPVSELE